MNRLKRQTMIKRLVTENEIHTQSELLALLEKENIHTTQATISRDIRELNLNKVDNGQGEAYYRILNNSALRPKYKTDEERLVDIIIETGVSLTQIEFPHFSKYVLAFYGLLRKLLKVKILLSNGFQKH